MKTAIATVVACVLASGLIHAQKKTPKNCTVYIELETGAIGTVTNKKTTCNFEGKVKFLVSNNADVKYKVKVHDFKPRTDGDCTKPEGVTGNVPITETKTELLFSVMANDEDKDKFDVKALGGASVECYKFDVTLYDKDWKYITTMDPDLEITEPMGPPPAPPAKPKE